MRAVALVLSLAVAANASPLTDRASPRTVPTSAGWTSRSLNLDIPVERDISDPSDKAKRQSWAFTQPGTTGVLAMMMAVVSPTQLLIIDRTAHNPLQVDGHNAWAAVYSLTSNSARPVRVQTNSFCAGGAWLSNGTLANIGGFRAEMADIPDENGLQAVRHWYPEQCPDSGTAPCAFVEYPNRVRLGASRWYPSVARVGDGSLIVIGGSNNALFMNNAAANVPSYEYYPPRNFGGYNGVPIPSPLLTSSLNANLFPIAFYLPLSGRVFIAANTKAWMYDIQGNYEIALPDLPNGVRVTYPMAGTGVMLPLSPENGYVPTILICGGSAGSDTVAANQLNAQDPASRQCSRLEFTTAGLRAGWQVELMPEARIMPDAVMLPDGRLLILNGGATGYSGYGNVAGQQGSSNAANPTMRPVIYDPAAPVGQRFSTAGLPTSDIPRLYHSAATLLPSGAIAITGSNPNGDYTTRQPFPTEYRLEILSPPYMTQPRPTFSGLPAKANYGAVFTLAVTLPPNTQTVKACIMDYGFSTHSVHMDQRHVWLVTSVVNGTHISVTMPPNFTIYPPGPAWLHVLADGVPSTGTKMLVGTGVSPRTDVAAWENMLNKTGNPT